MRLTVTDDDGGIDTVSHDVVVVANQAPRAAYTSDIEDLTVTTDGSSSTGADGSIESYAWDFGDGTTGTSRTESHVYTTPGEYTVRLTVKDDAGAQDSVEHEVTVTNPRTLHVTTSSAPCPAAGARQTAVAVGLFLQAVLQGSPYPVEPGR